MRNSAAVVAATAVVVLTTWTTINFILESAVFLVMGYQLPDFVAAARVETTGGEILQLVLLVLALLVALRFLGLAWPALNDHFADPHQGDEIRARLDQFEEKLDSMSPADVREENRLAWRANGWRADGADLAFEEREPITTRGIVVIAWAGMRGVVTVAAALTIPVGTSHRATVVLAAFLVALITLALFGLTLPAVIRRMRFESVSTEEKQGLRAGAPPSDRRVGGRRGGPARGADHRRRAGRSRAREHAQGRILPRMLTGVRTVREVPPGAIEQTLILQRRYLDAVRDALASERSIGAYDSQTYRQVETLLDSLEQRIGA